MTAPANPAPAYLAVDWGTSSLRVWVLSHAGDVLAERRSAEGMDTLHQDGFEAVLRRHLAALGPIVEALPRPLPIVLCGMVGARQGWREAPYVDVPTRLDAVVDRATVVSVEGIDARILPGLARRNPERPDVMRGEETQLLGLLLDHPDATGLVAMPGTHAKWVRLRGGTVTGFTTAMTGELFALLSRHSILRHSIGDAEPTSDPDSPAFREGLTRALADPGMIGAKLFAVRAGGLLFGTGPEASADLLSGLLIGAEVGAALIGLDGNEPVILVATGKLARLYSAAVEAGGRTVRLVDADVAVRKGLLHAARRFWPPPA
ncbi:2-dehydro-3-deoxygalactonokinase [Chthonobacter albigriseus]|uniref:2-dehydro-3-deoxygalactonokinase n=1 Tax=Chthonobacter albigriseus TaxID=1683161 RepID=UPI0015EEF2B9